MQNKYPLWKNILLVILAFVGLLYAIPNLYSEDPAVQISSQKPVELQKLQEKVQALLAKNQIPYVSMRTRNDALEVLFSSTDTQLLARDDIKNALGSDYIVALNLVSATPSWLRFLGAEPMKQGLDLRGGVHFLLEVDVDSVVSHRYEGLAKNMGQMLREASIRYKSIRYIPSKGIYLQFADSVIMKRAKSILREKFASLDVLTTDLQNQLTATLTIAELRSIQQGTIEQTMTILRNRVNELGVGEAVVQQQGATRVAVDLPGIQDAARAKQILGGTATLQFYLVDQEHDAELAERSGVIPVNTKLYTLHGRPLLIKRQVVLNGDAITSANAGFDAQTASYEVQVQLGGGGERYFSKITKENIGKPMAIVFVETKTTQSGTAKPITRKEEKVISAPIIQSALGSNFVITGLLDNKEASNLALLLRAGALPAVIYSIEERTVGPSLGKENIRRGLISLEVGMGLILILMVAYYRFFGLVANIALFLNLILLSALLSLIGNTLTLPGIAAFVLTVGMAVDANVLIYERIREELRRGISAQAAIYAGYDKAFATIVDANVTTLIVGIILFAIGTGPIKGFAVILSLGLVTSMLTSITYTRAMVNWYCGGKKTKTLSIGI